MGRQKKDDEGKYENKIEERSIGMHLKGAENHLESAIDLAEEIGHFLEGQGDEPKDDECGKKAGLENTASRLENYAQNLVKMLESIKIKLGAAD